MNLLTERLSVFLRQREKKSVKVNIHVRTKAGAINHNVNTNTKTIPFLLFIVDIYLQYRNL